MSLKDKLLGNNPAPLTPEPAVPDKPQASVKVNAPMNMQDRIRQANKMQKVNPGSLFTGDGRAVALLLDDSSSMQEIDSDPDGKSKIGRLNEGVQLFAQEIDFNQTKVTALPMNGPEREFTSLADMSRSNLRAAGGTPMDDVIEKFGGLEAKQGILISDGEANSDVRAVDKARVVAEQGKRLDCIHIGTSSGGEKTLKEIAEITGGMFFKFKDVASFAASLKQLAPRNRAQLARKSADEIKMLTGASEVIK